MKLSYTIVAFVSASLMALSTSMYAWPDSQDMMDKKMKMEHAKEHMGHHNMGHDNMGHDKSNVTGPKTGAGMY